MRFLCTLREFPSCFRSWGFTRGVQSCQVLRSLLELPGEVTLSLPAALPGDFVLLLSTCSNQTLSSPCSQQDPSRPGAPGGLSHGDLRHGPEDARR